MKTAYSCVVDGNDTFYFQSLMLLASLIGRARVDRSDIYVHVMDSCDALVEATYRAVGVNVVRTLPTARSDRHCNKLEQLKTRAFTAYDRVVLCDCDLAFDAPIGGADRMAVGAKIVDLPNPSLEVLRSILRASGQARSPATVPTTFVRRGAGYELNANGHFDEDHCTLENNCNGGIYVIDAEWWTPLGEAWTRWAAWLDERPGLLGAWWGHLDQISFALATWDLGVSVTQLDVADNCPIHLEGPWPDLLSRQPNVLHVHTCFDRDGSIAWRGQPASGIVGRANRAFAGLLAAFQKSDPLLHDAIVRRRARWLTNLH